MAEIRARWLAFYSEHAEPVGRGVELFGVILLLLNFLDGFYKLSKLSWHLAYQILMSFCSFAMSVRLIQLILAFRGE